MKYLDYSVMPSVLRRYFSSDEIRRSRLAGKSREIESDYFDIVRFFGSEGLDPARVAVDRLREPFEFADQRIARYSAWVEHRLREEGRLYHGPKSTGVVTADFESEEPSITVQPCDYGKQAGSCFALDVPHPVFDQATLRDYYLGTCASRRIEDSPLALCLGVCGMVLTGDTSERLLLVRRAAHLASLEDSIGPSAAGSVDWEEGSESLDEMVRRALTDEIREELLLAEEQYSIVPLAWAREVFRGERPQVFCLIEAHLTPGQLARHMEQVITGSDEIASFDLVALEGQAVPKGRLDELNHEARMNWWLISEWLMAGP
jgi:hypothetical protein